MASQELVKADVQKALENLRNYVRTAFSKNDSSHDYAHTKRVTSLAIHIASQSNARLYPASDFCVSKEEISATLDAAASSSGLDDSRDLSQSSTTASTISAPRINPEYDLTLVEIAALSHDLYDHKYTSSTSKNAYPDLHSLLTHLSFSKDVSNKVCEISKHVSWSYESKHREDVLQVLAKIPELGPVQDADRLDAIGAHGLGRAFVYAASKEAESRYFRSQSPSQFQKQDGNGNGEGKVEVEVESEDGQGHLPSDEDGERGQNDLVSAMNNSRLHIDEKLLLIETRMKTEVGKEMAKERTEFLRAFARRWDEEETGYLN